MAMAVVHGWLYDGACVFRCTGDASDRIVSRIQMNFSVDGALATIIILLALAVAGYGIFRRIKSMAGAGDCGCGCESAGSQQKIIK